MGLKDIKIRRVYDTSHIKAVEEFFNPALNQASQYQRASAYFSSNSLRLLATGLSSLFWSGGKMQLLLGSPESLSEEDWNAIIASKNKAYEEISKLFPSIEDLKKMMEDDNVRAFAQLLQSGRLEIKFVLARRIDQLFHVKFGLIVDSDGNGVAFSGSPNETLHGLDTNIEAFNTFRSWKEGEADFYNDYASIFSNYWEGRYIDGIVVSDLPERVKRDLINAELQYSEGNANKLPSKAYLRPYQLRAIEYWKKHNYRGVLEMATGTGKTLTAFGCIKELFKEVGRHPIVIAVPTIEVARQWSYGWMAFFGRYPIVYRGVNKEKYHLSEYTSILGDEAVIIATYNFLSGEYFHRKLLPLIGNNAVFIADEMHHLGAPAFRKLIEMPYQFRLGLSATPHRLFDCEGNEAIMNFFGKDFFSYTIKEAIEDGYLSEYSYFPRFVELSDEEAEEYNELTQKIPKYITKNPKTRDKEMKKSNYNWEKLIYARARIVKKASAKYNEIYDILLCLKQKGKLSKLIIFCEDNDQLGKVRDQLAILGESFGVISGETPNSKRAEIISEFDSGKINAILSMKVMDEGIDIGSAARAILMSSAKDTRQYIQRAGRVLRKSNGKAIAEIFDIIVYVDPRKIGNKMWEIEQKIIESELKRALYFTEMAKNQIQCFKILESFREKIYI